MSFRPVTESIARLQRVVRLSTALFATATLASARIAHAQPTPTEAIRPSPPPAVPAKATTAFVADLGFLNTTGNTEVTTVSASEKITHTQGLWRFEEQFTTVYGQNGGKENTNLLRAGIGAEYALRSNIGLATGVLYDRNRFAGIAQRTEEYLGFLFKVLQAKEDSLRFETGGSLTQQKGTDGTSDNFPAARGAVWYKHAFTATAYFLQTVEAIPNLKTSTDWRMNTESAVVAPLSKKLAIKAGYVVRYDNLPEPGFKKMDRFLTTGLQLSF